MLSSKSGSTFNNNSGFSLIELMIVVAIIGVLSTVAIPNFQRFAAKARQVEAKSALSAIYTSEKAYFAEGGIYTYCLYQAGYIPEGSRRFYTTGFAVTVPWTNLELGTDQSSRQLCNFGTIAWSGSWRNDGIFVANSYANPALNGAALSTSFINTGTSFEAVAFGSVSTLGIYDVWRIDDNRSMANLQPGM